MKPLFFSVLFFGSIWSFFPSATFAADCPPGVVLSEAMINPAIFSDTEGEWLELFNESAVAVNLKDLTLIANQSSFTIKEDFFLEPLSYSVACRNKEALSQKNIPCFYQYEKLSLVNSGGKIIFGSEQKECSSLEYQASSVKEGVSLEFFPSSNLWKASTSLLENSEYGTPGTAPKDSSLNPTSILPGSSSDTTDPPNATTNSSAEPSNPSLLSAQEKTNSYPSLVVQAIFPNPSGLDTKEKEFVVISNPNNFNVNLYNWKLLNQSEDDFIFNTDLILGPKKTIQLFGNFFGFDLHNSSETISLVAPNKTLINSLSFKESAKENKVFFKNNDGYLFWINPECLEESCPSSSATPSTESATLSGSSRELIFPKDFLTKTDQAQSHFTSLKKKPNLSSVLIVGTVSSLASPFGKSGFYLQLNGGGILVKTGYIHSFQEQDRLIISGTLYKNNDRLFLKSEKEEQARADGQKKLNEASLDICLSKKDCSPLVASLVEFSGTISYAKNKRFLIKNKNGFELLLEFPPQIDQDLLAIKKNSSFKVKGILEEDSLGGKKIITNSIKEIKTSISINQSLMLATQKTTASQQKTVTNNEPANTLLKTQPPTKESKEMFNNPLSLKKPKNSLSLLNLKNYFVNFLFSVFNF
jgi:hypothetical protein